MDNDNQFKCATVCSEQVGCVPAFFLGVLLPISFIFLHASLRLRNMKSKVFFLYHQQECDRNNPESNKLLLRSLCTTYIFVVTL